MWTAFLITAYILYLFTCIAHYTLIYLNENVSVDSFSQLLYTMQVSMGGAENTIGQILGGFLQTYWLHLLLATILFIIAFRVLRKKKKNEPVFSLKGRKLDTQAFVLCNCVSISCCLLFCGQLGANFRDIYHTLGVSQYLDERSRLSNLYEEYYVDPASTSLQFPETKRNLIYIYCESMESSFASRLQGGAMEHPLINNLYNLAKENTDFSSADSTALNGGRVTSSASWTIAGMVAQTSGIPLCFSNSEFTKNFDTTQSFLPAVTTLGDLLEQQGYHNYLIVGSDAEYGGRKNYFTQHGNYEVFDLYTAREEGYIPSNYKEWWGFEDEKLFTFAKEKILDLAGSSEPFNFTMLTADTHFKDGYLCEHCPDLYDEQMENVIVCSDRAISDFVSWIRQQDFYSNTTIVIAGDHLSMDGYFPTVIDTDAYNRKTYFSIINAPLEYTGPTREFTTLDIFPTTLAALGVQIEGNRLGLGTNLYSNTSTLCEQMGFDSLNQQISYRSQYYEDVLQAGMFDENEE